MSENVEKVETKVFDEARRGYVVFCFHPDRDGRGFRVYTRTRAEVKENPDGYGNYLCDVQMTHDKEAWTLRANGEYELPQNIKSLRFPDKEMAAKVYFCYITNLEKEKEQHPLPDDITRHLKRRARELREKRQQLETEFHQLVAEQREFLFFARKYKIDEIEWTTDNADAIQACQDLVDYCPDEEYGAVNPDERKTLIDYVYEKWGKDAGRTYRARLRRALKFADPACDP